MTDDEYAKLPEHLIVRQLRYQVGRPGFRTKEVTLVTTLLDADLYPLLELAELHRQRWQAEQHLRDLKTTLNMDKLRCKTVDGVLKELHVFVLVYNLARVVLCAAARRQGLPIAQLSFIDAVRWLRSAKTGEVLSKLVVNALYAGYRITWLFRHGILNNTCHLFLYLYFLNFRQVLSVELVLQIIVFCFLVDR
jgi:hypothetical protein